MPGDGILSDKDQFQARSARVEVVVDAAAQPSRNGSEGEQD